METVLSSVFTKALLYSSSLYEVGKYYLFLLGEKKKKKEEAAAA